jgi:hypothetical protein
MVMYEQSRRLREPLRWGRREKTVLAAVLAVVVLGLGALVVYGLSSGAPARADCVSVTFPSTLGAGQANGCGAKARAICASGAFKGVEEELQHACARAGFAYKPPS